MEKKILFLDLDGTLLNDRKELTPGNRDAMEQAAARGHRLVITSGRPLKSTLIQAERMGLNGEGCYVIAYNGAVIYDCSRKKEIFRQTLALEDLYAVFDEANRQGVYIQSYDEKDTVLIEPHNDPAVAERYSSSIHLDFRVTDNIRTGLSVPPVKALMIDFENHAPLERMEKWVNETMAGRVNCFFSSRYYLETVPAGMNKGNAVRAMCRLLEVPVENTVAAGDEANDISMLQAAGIGAAMQNAVPEAKAAADYITERDNNHDGIAEIIERFLN